MARRSNDLPDRLPEVSRQNLRQARPFAFLPDLQVQSRDASAETRRRIDETWNAGAALEKELRWKAAANKYEESLVYLRSEDQDFIGRCDHCVEVWARSGDFAGLCLAQERKRRLNSSITHTLVGMSQPDYIQQRLADLLPRLAYLGCEPSTMWIDQTANGYAFAVFHEGHGQATWISSEQVNSWKSLQKAFAAGSKDIAGLAVEAFCQLPEVVRSALQNELVFLLPCNVTMSFPFELLMPAPDRVLGERVVFSRFPTLESLSACLTRVPETSSAYFFDGYSYRRDLDHLREFLNEAKARYTSSEDQRSAGLVVAIAHGATDYLHLSDSNRLKPTDIQGLSGAIGLFLTCHVGGESVDVARKLSGFPSQFLSAGGSCFVGCMGLLPDTVGGAFGRDVLKALDMGADIGQAIMQARRAARLRNQNNPLAWSGLILWGNPKAALPRRDK